MRNNETIDMAYLRVESDLRFGRKLSDNAPLENLVMILQENEKW